MQGTRRRGQRTLLHLRLLLQHVVDDQAEDDEHPQEDHRVADGDELTGLGVTTRPIR